MFPFRRKKMDNAATIAPVMPRPVPGPTTIHNHSASWAGIIAIGFVCFLALFPVFWWSLVFLFDQMGSRQPGRDAAALIVSVPVLVIVAFVLRWLILAVLREVLDFFRDVEGEKTERVRAQLLATQTSIDPGRMNADDYDFAQVVLACMSNAFNWLEREGYSSFPARWRPWSLAEAKKTADVIGIKISQDRANEVSKWLADKGVITRPTDGQISRKYSDLTKVRALLDKEFGMPIKQVSPALRENRGFEFTGD